MILVRCSIPWKLKPIFYRRKSNIDPELYHAIADAGMDSMTEYFEALADDGSIELEGFDVEYSVRWKISRRKMSGGI